MTPFSYRFLLGVVVILATSLARSPAADGQAPSTVKIAEGGQALLPIVISPKADARTEALARDLAAGLERITGSRFEIVRGELKKGIVLGTAQDWPGALPPVKAGLSPLLAREDHLLRTTNDALWIVGREPVGVQDAIWGFFQRLGFRQFFPGRTWEIWPRDPNLTVALDVHEIPDYHQRLFAFTGIANSAQLKKLGVSADPAGQKAYEQYLADVEQWKVRNRLGGGFALETTHSYGAIVRRNPEHFERNPQDIVPRESGETRKLDPSRPTVLEIAARDAIKQLEADPKLDCVSLEPSDGGGWRIDSPLGKPSNQAVTLANHVARSIQEKFPGRKVGMLAYNEHSPPPDFDVDPNVIVMAATMFLRGGYTIDQVIDDWHARKADLGIREYLSLWSSSHGHPRSRTCRRHCLHHTYPSALSREGRPLLEGGGGSHMLPTWAGVLRHLTLAVEGL